MAIDTPEQAQFIRDLRVRIQENKDNDRPEYEGITREEIQRFVAILRGNRAVEVAKRSKGNTGGSKSKAPAMTDEELKALFS